MMSEEFESIATVITFLMIGLYITAYIIVITINNKRFQENPNFFIDLVTKWSPYFSPIEIAIMTSQRSDVAYLLYLAELAKQNIIKISPDCQYVAYPINFDLQTWQGHIINILDICKQKFEKRGSVVQYDCGYWILPTEALDLHLGDILFDVRNNIITNLVRKKVYYLKDNNPNFNLRMLKKDVSKLRWIPHNLPRIDFLQIVNDNSNPLLPILYAQKNSNRSWYDTQCDNLTKITSSVIGWCRGSILEYALSKL